MQEINGAKIVKIMPIESGEGKKGTWEKLTLIVEYGDEYPKKLAVQCWNEKAQIARNFKISDKIDFSFNAESREYNEKWYTDCKVWKLQKVGNITEPIKPTVSEAKADDKFDNDLQPIVEADENDLPF